MAAPGYRAPGWLANPHLHTIYGSLFVGSPRVAYRRERWETPDGDFVDLDHADGPPEAPRVVLFHGLEGSYGWVLKYDQMPKARATGT